MCSTAGINRHEIFHSFFHSLNATQLAAISFGWGMGHPGAYVYIHRLLHRLGYRIGNHRQLSFVPIQWVTDMSIYNASQTCPVWLWESHWQPLAMHSKHGYRCSARQPLWVLQRLSVLALLVQGECEHRDATQKLTGNGKDLHILISIGIVTTGRWYLSFYWV